MVPPFLLQTDDNPKGVPGPVFEARAERRIPDPLGDRPHNIDSTHPEESNAALVEFLSR